MALYCACCKRRKGAGHKLSCDTAKNPFLYPKGPEYKDCSKVRYADEEQAQDALEKCWRQRRRGRVEVRHYYHDVCGGYHLTSKPRKEAP